MITTTDPAFLRLFVWLTSLSYRVNYYDDKNYYYYNVQLLLLFLNFSTQYLYILKLKCAKNIEKSE